MEESKELIGGVNKNSQEIVKVHVSTFKSKVCVDVRTFVQDEGKDPGVVIPTKKGVNLTPALMLELLPILTTARERAAELSGGAH